MPEDPDVRILQRRRCLLDQHLDRRDADLDPAQVLQQPRGLTARYARRGQRRRGRRDARPERALRHPGRQRRERAMPTPATGPHSPVLTHLDHDLDVTDLMRDRVPVSDPVRLADRRAATVALRRPVGLHTIRVGDHRPMPAGMTRLTALRTTRPLLLGPRLARVRRIARRRQRTVTRATTRSGAPTPQPAPSTTAPDR